jgi:rRNA maturation RNase YbeY
VRRVAGEAGSDLVGEIIISLDTAKKQAKEHKKTVMQEMQLLFVHGVLHIFGYDHEEPKNVKSCSIYRTKLSGIKAGDRYWKLLMRRCSSCQKRMRN